MPLDEPLSRSDGITGKRDPVEVQHRQAALSQSQDPARFRDGGWAVEPVPALSGGDHVGAVVSQNRRLGGALVPLDHHPVRGGHRRPFRHQTNVGVDTHDVAPSAGQLAGNGARAGAEVDDPLPREPDAEVGEAFRGAMCEANTYSNAQALIQESLKEEGLSWGYSSFKWDECSCEEQG